MATRATLTTAIAIDTPTSRGGLGMRFPSSASPAQTSAVMTQAIPISSAARWPCCTPSAVFMSPLTSAVLCTRAATATVPAMPATTRATRAGQRLRGEHEERDRPYRSRKESAARRGEVHDRREKR